MQASFEVPTNVLPIGHYTALERDKVQSIVSGFGRNVEMSVNKRDGMFEIDITINVSLVSEFVAYFKKRWREYN